MMGVLARHDPLDAGSADVAIPDFASITQPVRGLRIGYARSMTEEAGVDGEVLEAMEAGLKVLEVLGAVVCDVELAPSLAYADVASLISRSESYAIHEHDLAHTPHLFGKIFRQRIAPGALVRASDYINAMRERTRLIAQLADVMKNVDLVVTPSWPSPASILGEGGIMSRRKASFMRPFNVTGSPALSVCNGFSSRGLPLAMQIVGRPFEDHIVLRAGHAFEIATEFRKRRPIIEAKTSAAA